MSDETLDLLDLTAKIVAAHVAGNATTADAVPGLIGNIYRTLAAIGQPVPAAAPQTPAVPIRKSVFPDHIVCLEDGKRLQMLKRHLMNHYHMTPADYRAKWGLPADYPMVAPSYAARRSDLAKSIGLGTRRTATLSEPLVTQVPARRARGSRG